MTHEKKKRRIPNHVTCINNSMLAFESMLDIDRLLKIKNTLSCRFSGGTFTHSIPSLFANSVSILVALATDGCTFEQTNQLWISSALIQNVTYVNQVQSASTPFTHEQTVNIN